MSIPEQVATISGKQVAEMNEAGEETAVFVEYYTDPLCSWSWAFEAQWRRLRYEYGERMSWRYHMGGLISTWQSYNDPLNDIRSPAQMGPQWFQVRELSGVPLDDRLWQIDPPASSYPACIAVKAAERQGQVLAEGYLRRLREAAMLERRNIARQDILLAIAQEMARDAASGNALDFDRFHADLVAPETMDAFRQNLRDAAYYGIGRFPALILYRLAGPRLLLVGYHPYDALLDALKHLAPDLDPKPEIPPEELAVAYVTYWQRVTARELAEALGSNIEKVAILLKSLIASGKLSQAENSRSETSIYVPAPQR